MFYEESELLGQHSFLTKILAADAARANQSLSAKQKGSHLNTCANVDLQDPKSAKNF